MTSFHYNILQDVERECLNQLKLCLINHLDIYFVLLMKLCLINHLDIYFVLLVSFMPIVTMANLHLKSPNFFYTHFYFNSFVGSNFNLDFILSQEGFLITLYMNLSQTLCYDQTIIILKLSAQTISHGYSHSNKIAFHFFIQEKCLC